MSENNYLKPFEPFNGSVVKYRGVNHILKYQEINAVYPYEHVSRSCFLEPQDKSTKYYQETKRALGDDWSTDLTSIPTNEYVKICDQLGILEDILYGGN